MTTEATCTVKDMVRAFRSENERLRQQISNLMQASTFDEIFCHGAINDRGRELVERMDVVTKVIEEAEKFLTRAEKRGLDAQTDLIRSTPDVPEALIRLARDTSGMYVVPMYFEGREYCGCVFRKRGDPGNTDYAIIRNHRLIDQMTADCLITIGSRRNEVPSDE